MKLSKFMIAFATVVLLTSCGEGASTSSSVDNTSHSETTSEVETSSQETSSDETTSSDVSSEPEKETYSVKIIENKGVSLTSDKQKASLGEVVTITAEIKDPSYRLVKVLYDSLECTKLSDTSYCFIMPDHPVKVSCETILEGDVTIQGEISAVLNKEGDIYVAKAVKVDKDCNFDVIIKDKDGETHKLDVTDIDRFKTFANVSFANNASLQNLHIAGRATYDFYYDVNNGDKPLYIKRVSVDELPSNANTVYDLFEGSVRSASSVNPEGVNSVTFINTLANEKVEWKAYDDNTTYAKITQKDVENNYVEKGVYYTSLKNDELTVIDTFTPGSNPNYDNNVFVSDKDAYSGQYKVSDVKQNGEKTEDNEFDYRHPFVNESVANSLINTPLITMEMYESEFMHGYRVGYTVGDAVTQANTIVTSTSNASGGFTTIVKGSNTIDSTKDRTHSGPTVLIHNEYRTTLTFDKAGALLNGEYLHKTFGQDAYNFNSCTFLSGDADANFENKGKLENKITIAYTYGDRFTNDTNFDPSKYLISEISDIVIDNPDAIGDLTNQLNIGDTVDEHITASFKPATALNAYQYAISDSSNKDVIDYQANKGYVAKKEGTSEISVGIVNGLGVVGKATVNVVAGQLVRSFYMNARWGKFQEITSSDSANVFTGQENVFGLDCKSGKNKDMPIPLNTTLEIVGDAKGFTARIDHSNQTIVIDGTSASYDGSATFKVVINTPSYDPDWKSCHPSTLTFTIYKGIANDALLGTWTSEASDLANSSITFTLDKSGNESYPFKGKLVTKEGTFDFYYHFNATKNTIKVKLLDEKLSLSDIELVYHSETQTLDAYFVINEWNEEGQKIIEVFGWADGENKAYDVFKKA